MNEPIQAPGDEAPENERPEAGKQATWGGRFQEAPAEVAARFSESVSFDKRLAPQDIRGSIAHARMLASRGVLSAEEAEAIASGLTAIGAEIEAGRMEWRVDREDVHMNIEATLSERIGEAGRKLHTGRSRNDQVATDMRLWTRDAIDRVVALLDGLLGVIALRAEGTARVLLPGYTHLQRAQPVRLGHHLLAWAQMLERDRGRLIDARARLNECPLGAAALAGTTFELDREATAQALGFARPMSNSMDAVADRDFLLESLSALSICAVHLSRIAEELVLWSSQEFGFVEMSDAFTTGSSIMPQKKNPDMAELVRGKCGRVLGHLVNLLVLMKGLPLTYNRDMQEDKPPAFDAFDTVEGCLGVLAGCVAGARFQEARMRAALRGGFLDATEVADWLSARGLPFRDAHHVSGRLVFRAIEAGCTLAELPLSVFQEEHPSFDESIYPALDPETAIERRALYGGPALAQVLAEVEALGARLGARGVDLGALRAELGVREGA